MNLRSNNRSGRSVYGILQVVVLLFYCIYSLSPLYRSLQFGVDRTSDRSHAVGQVKVGIVWLNFLVSTFTDEAQVGDIFDAARLAAAPRDGRMILVKKRRAVLREQSEVRPLSETAFLPCINIDHPATSSRDFEIARDPRLRESDGYVGLNTGLSPPACLFS